MAGEDAPSGFHSDSDYHLEEGEEEIVLEKMRLVVFVVVYIVIVITTFSCIVT